MIHASAEDRREQLLVAQRIMALRKRLGMSQEGFSAASRGHLSRTEVNKAEKGKTLARTDKWLNGVAAAAGLDMKEASLYLTGKVSLDALGVPSVDQPETMGAKDLTSLADKTTHKNTRLGLDEAKRLRSNPPAHGGTAGQRSKANPVRGTPRRSRSSG